jgi:hypothetical protein
MTPIIFLLLTAVLFVLYKYRYIFSLLRYRLAISPTQKNGDKQTKPKVERVCQKCGDSMESGYAVINFMSEDDPSFMLSRLGLGYGGYSPGSFLPFSSRVLSQKAYRCRKRGIIGIESSKPGFREAY